MTGKKFHFISQLSCYTLKHTLFRVFTVGSIGLLFLLLSINIIEGGRDYLSISGDIKIILAFIIVSECNVFIEHLFERYFPFPEKIGLRVFIHLFVSGILIVLIYYYFEYLLQKENLIQDPGVRLMLALGVIFLIILIIISLSMRITERWINSRDELVALKQAKLLSDYNSLQDQLNPHFLFNNLSVLKSMIIYAPEAAVVFTQNFTDVYRYVLKSKDRLTVALKDEIAFIESYIGLHKERLGESLKVSMKIDTASLQKSIPPLALQLLVENAIKHNIASKDEVLFIEIYNDLETICVQNNYQPKESSYSTKNGLKNLIKRYEFQSEKDVEIIQDALIFRVILPLL